MDAWQVIAYLVGAGGGGAAILSLFRGIGKWIDGSAGREKAKNTDIATQRHNAILERDAAIEDRDEADRKRRIAFEYASVLRRQLIEAGITPVEWPTEKNAPAITDSHRTQLTQRSNDDR